MISNRNKMDTAMGAELITTKRSRLSFHLSFPSSLRLLLRTKTSAKKKTSKALREARPPRTRVCHLRELKTSFADAFSFSLRETTALLAHTSAWSTTWSLKPKLRLTKKVLAPFSLKCSQAAASTSSKSLCSLIWMKPILLCVSTLRSLNSPNSSKSYLKTCWELLKRLTELLFSLTSSTTSMASWLILLLASDPSWNHLGTAFWTIVDHSFAYTTIRDQIISQLD